MIALDTVTAGGLSAKIYSSGDGPRPLICAFMGPDEASGSALLLGDIPFAMAAVEVEDWDRDLSPWPAKRVFRGGTDFSGGADALLGRVCAELLPAAERALGLTPTYRAAAGYSLGGLCAVYSLYRTDLFTAAASMSGSLWFDGFTDFMAANATAAKVSRVYFSVGDEEKHTRNPRFAKVEDCTERALGILKARGADGVFRLEPGDHFTDPAGRIARGLRWLLGADI